MKIKLCTMLLGFFLISMSAQSQTSFALLGGLNIQNHNGKVSNGDKSDNDLIVGFHAGVNALVPIAPEFFFSPGLLYSVKGASNETLGVTSTFRINYLEIPLNLVYKARVGSGDILFGFGPYVAYALGGKANYEGGSISAERDIVIQNTIEAGDGLEAYFRPLDAGANIFFGYQLPAGLFFQLNTQLGLLNIHPEDNRVTNDQSVVKNTGFGLSLGFRF